MSESNNVPPHVPADRVWMYNHTTEPDLLTGNPFAVFSRIQQEGRDIFYTPEAWQGDGGAWYVTKGEYLKELLKSPELFSSKKGTGFDLLLGMPGFDLIPLELDPPEHMKYRMHFNTPLSPQAVAPREDSVRALAVELIEKVRAKGSCDFVEEFGVPFPVEIFMLIMGFPREDRDEILDYENRLLDASGGMEGRAVAARDIYSYLEKFVEGKRKHPGEDLATMILGIELDGRPITHDEIMGMYYLLFVGGLDTVASSLGFAFRYLANNPEARAELRANPSMIPGAVEEMFRLHSPVEVRRMVTEDCEFHGVSFKKGDHVNCITAMGSLDPDEFADPLVAKFDRKPNRHLAFVFGPHRCMGSNLARLEMRVAIEEWLKRIPEFDIEPGAKIASKFGAVVSLERLPLVW